MKRSLLALALTGLLSVACAHAAEVAPSMKGKGSSPLLSQPVRTTNGLISGVPGKIDGVAVFKGIPFGAPPIGDLRWKAPQPVAAWDGVRSGDKFGPVCLQPHQMAREPN